MNKILLAFLLTALVSTMSVAQVTITKGDLKLEIGAVMSSYLNFRYLKPTETNRSENKNRFRLRDARLVMKGEIGKNYEFKLQADFSNVGATTFDPEAPTLYDANVTYKGFKAVNVIVGYGLLPYSRTSMTGFGKSPYWQRSEAFRGDLFTRRDVGVTLQKSMLEHRIRAYAGVYTGVGELFYQGDNDPSGGFEYIGRLEASYPTRYKDTDIDDDISDKPTFCVGANVRYTKRNLPTGTAFIVGQTGTYGLKAIDGERTGLGADAAVYYKGISAQFETQSLTGKPQNDSDPFLRGLPKDATNGKFKFGGWTAQLNYFNKSIRTIVSVRYDQMDLNDLLAGHAERFSAAIAYQLSGYKSMIKAQYFNTQKEESNDAQRYKEQFRIGWQFALGSSD